MAIALSVVSLVVWIFGWFAFPDDIRDQFNWTQIATLVGFLVFVIGFMVALGTCTVHADEHGLRLRNVWQRKSWTWDEISGVRFRSGDPWALVLTGDDRDPQRHAILAIQAADGKWARDRVDELRELAREISP